MYEGSKFSTSLTTLIIFCIFYYSYPNGYKLESHCGFCLHFPDGLSYLALFHVLNWAICIFSLDIVLFLKLFFTLEYFKHTQKKKDLYNKPPCTHHPSLIIISSSPNLSYYFPFFCLLSGSFHS